MIKGERVWCDDRGKPEKRVRFIGWRACRGESSHRFRLAILLWIDRRLVCTREEDACIDARPDRSDVGAYVHHSCMWLLVPCKPKQHLAVYLIEPFVPYSRRWIILITIYRYYLIHRLIWCLLHHLGYLAVQIRWRRRGGGAVTH